MSSFATDAAAYYEQTYGDDSYRRGLQNELRETDKALKNIVKAIERGAFSDTLQQRLADLEERKRALKDTIEAEDAKAALMKDKHGIAAIFRKYANANLNDPEVRDSVLEYFIEGVYAYDDRLIIQTDLVDYVGDCRHEAPWAFGDYDVGFARELEFDYFAFGSTIRNRAPQKPRRAFFVTQ